MTSVPPTSKPESGQISEAARCPTLGQVTGMPVGTGALFRERFRPAWYVRRVIQK
jgi:hypothetical protein